MNQWLRRVVWIACLVAGFAAVDPAFAGNSKPAVPAIVVPALAGKVDGHAGNSDSFVWSIFTSIVKPSNVPNRAEFQTWATDEDVYTQTPSWPDPAAERPLHASRRQVNFDHTQPLPPCAAAANPWVANFPLDGCLAEVVYRNRPQYDYIVNNGLNTPAGAAAYYATDKPVLMPRDSIAIKTDWVPITDILKWVPELRTLSDVRRTYYTTVSNNVEYGLVAMHISSAQNPEWVWGTFEHQNNPGRCDLIGCYDSYGARRHVVRPNDKVANTQYGPCVKTAALDGMMRRAGLAAVWNNYCLKSTQVSFTDAKGKPSVLTNTVTERLSANDELMGSCIGCHVYAAFGANGQPTQAAQTMLAYNPVGKPITSVFKDARSYDFMWGLVNFPPPPP